MIIYPAIPTGRVNTLISTFAQLERDAADLRVAVSTGKKTPMAHSEVPLVFPLTQQRLPPSFRFVPGLNGCRLIKTCLDCTHKWSRVEELKGA